MAKLLFCPHCGATMAVSRPACGRCGHELTLADSDGTTITTTTLNRRQFWWRRLGGATGIVLLVLSIVVGLALVQRLRTGRTSDVPTLSEAVQSVASDDDEFAGTRAGASPAAIEPRVPDAQPAGPVDLDRALELALAAVDKQPDDTIALNSVGQVYVARGSPELAVDYLERAVRLQPGVVDFQFNLASAFERAGKPHRAAAILRELSLAHPDDGRIHHNLGLALRHLGLEDDAVGEFRRAVALMPDEAPAWLAYGQSLNRLGRNLDAADAFQRYLDLYPDIPDAAILRQRVTQLRLAPPKNAPQAKAPR